MHLVRWAATLACVGFAAAAAAPRYSEAQALAAELQELVDGHPQLQSARDNAAAAKAAIGGAAAAQYPDVLLTTDTGYKRIDGPSQRAADNIWSRPYDQASLRVTQNLYNGGRTASQIETATLTQLSAESDVRNTRQQLLFQGINQYVEVVRQSRLVDLARKNEKIIQDRLNLEDERVQRGGGTAVDVLLAKTRLQLAKERRVVLEGSLRDSITRYTLVFGHPPDPAKMEDLSLPAYLVPDSVDVALQEALQRNPGITSAAHKVDIARTQQQTARGDFLPKVDMVGTMNWEKDREGTMGIRRDAQLGVQVTWDLFSGFSTKAGVSQAALSYSAAMNDEHLVARQVEQEIRLAWQGVSTACDRRLLLDNAVSIAAEVHDARGRLRDAGQDTVLNVLDAEGELFNSEINLVTSIYDEKLAIFRLGLAMGRDLLVEAARQRDAVAQLSAYEGRCAIPSLEPAAAAGRTAAAAPAPAPGAPANPFAPPAQGAPANPFAPPANPFALPPTQGAAPANPFALP